MIQQVMDEEVRFDSALIVSESNGEFKVVVNGRATPRTAVASSEFLSNRDGSGRNEEFVIATSPYHDMPVIVARSPWLTNQVGTEYSE